MSKILHYVSSHMMIFIFLLAFILRFWHLGSTPPSLYWDEVSQGYNAYSILKTGFDEHHEFLPIARFQAFGDYKAPVYIYLDAIAIAVFGKNEFAIRFPSAFFGVLSVLLTYFLVKEIFYKHKWRSYLSNFAAFFLAISPWHIQLSRVAYEANIATFFTILGLFLFFLAKRKSSYYFFLSVLSFVFAFYAFNAHRVFIPLLVLLLFIVYRKTLVKAKKTLSLSALLGIILLVPFFIYFQSPESKLRFQEVNIFSDLSVIHVSNSLQKDDANNLVGRIIHNRRVLYGLSYAKHYFDFFDPSFLFFRGDVNPRFSTQSTGQLYIFMLPLILLGIYKIIRSEDEKKYFLVGWLLIAPLAAATARETPHALRSETSIPIYEIIASFGALYLFMFFKKLSFSLRLGSILFFGLITIYFILDFLHSYYMHAPYKYSQDWQYGYKQAVQEVEKRKDEYDQIYFSNMYGRAYIYVLWYGMYDPESFWKNGIVKKDSFGFYNVFGFDKYVFAKGEDFNKDLKRNVLVVSGPGEFPKSAKEIKTIRFLDGSIAFRIGEIR